MNKPVQLPEEVNNKGLRAKIIGFNTFADGQDRDCIAITDGGKEITVDPFVGCSWDYEKREHLLNEWFEDPEAWLHISHDDEVWLTGEHSFKLISSAEHEAQAAQAEAEAQQDWIKEFDKWFNHGTKKEPRFAFASGVYPEVKQFIKDLLKQRGEELVAELEKLKKEEKDFTAIPELTESAFEAATTAVEYHGFNKGINKAIALVREREG